MFEDENKEMEEMREKLNRLYQKSPLLKDLRETVERRYGFQKTTLQRNIGIAERLIYYAVKKIEKSVAVARTVIKFGAADETRVENALTFLIASGDIKLEGDRIVCIKTT